MTTARYVFCYGSLRPDDDSGMSWTIEAVTAMRAQRAFIPGAKLYEDTYASLVFDKQSEKSVHGWILTTDPKLFEEKMDMFDQIEGYKPDGSGLYQRAIAHACLGDSQDCIGQPIGEKGVVVESYIYHRPNCNKSELIPSGDWLNRKRTR